MTNTSLSSENKPASFGKQRTMDPLERMYKLATVVLAAFVVLAVAIFLGRAAVYKIHEYERGLHLRGGRFVGVDEPGWHTQIPLVDTVIIVKVNERLQTTAKDVWAVGDCAGSPYFTHIGENDFHIVLANLSGGDRTTTGRQVPFCLFTDPELARPHRRRPVREGADTCSWRGGGPAGSPGHCGAGGTGVDPKRELPGVPRRLGGQLHQRVRKRRSGRSGGPGGAEGVSCPARTDPLTLR